MNVANVTIESSLSDAPNITQTHTYTQQMLAFPYVTAASTTSVGDYTSSISIEAITGVTLDKVCAQQYWTYIVVVVGASSTY